jgi:phosphate acyltransferase
VRIALDALGTDQAPSVELAGVAAYLASASDDVTVVLVGDEPSLRSGLGALNPPVSSERIEIVHAPDRIDPGEPPTTAIRRRPQSSIVVGTQLQKSGEVDAFVSAGSTGAVMASSLIFLRPLPGVDRPAIGTVLPTARGPVLMLDAGANVDCRPKHLEQFARLGQIYAQDLLGIPEPRVGLLNIGEEPEKGDDLAVQTHRLLTASPRIRFVGNVEGREIVRGACDVLVCDGFVGNVLLKFYESVAAFMIQLLRAELQRTGAEVDTERAFRILDYAEYGGAPLLGINGLTVICHGASTPKAIRAALDFAARAVRSGMLAHVTRELARDLPKES